MIMRRHWVVFLISISISSCAPKVEDGRNIEFILDWKAQMEHAGFFVAQGKGYYREVGLRVKILEGNSAMNAAILVGNGTYNLGVSSGAATVIARSRGAPVVSLAVINQRSPVVIYALKGAGIKRPQDLVSKRVGVNFGGIKFQEYRALLTKLSIDPTTITEIGMAGSGPTPLLTGQVDAMLGYTQDQPVLVKLRGYEVDQIPLADYGVNLYSTNIVGNEAFLRSHPDLVRRFIGASVKGWNHAIAYPEEAVSIYHTKHPESDVTFNRANFQHLIPLLTHTDKSDFGRQSASRWSHTQDTLYELKRIEKMTPLNQLFTNGFLPHTE